MHCTVIHCVGSGFIFAPLILCYDFFGLVDSTAIKLHLAYSVCLYLVANTKRHRPRKTKIDMNFPWGKSLRCAIFRVKVAQCSVYVGERLHSMSALGSLGRHIFLVHLCSR